MNTRQRTYLTGLIGRGIRPSRSPEMHEREAASLGMPLVYRRIDFDELAWDDARLADALHAARHIGFDGVNVTHPFKQRVLPLLDSVSPDAAALGAVNTVVFRGGAKRGFNTDWTGFRASLESGLPGIKLGEVALIGCGGAGSAVAYALMSMGVRRLRVFDSSAATAGAMAARIGAHFPQQRIVVAPDPAAALAAADGVVQTSPIGTTAHPGLPFPASLLHEGLWVSDVVYFPIETEFLRAARHIGCATLSGGGMAVHQAADAFRLMTGVEPSVGRMLATFESSGVNA